MNKEFSDKKDICKKMASESLMFDVVSEDLPKFLESVDQLEFTPATENLLGTFIKFFSEEKNLLINLALQK